MQVLGWDPPGCKVCHCQQPHTPIQPCLAEPGTCCPQPSPPTPGAPLQPQTARDSREQPEQGPRAAASSHAGTGISFTQVEETQARLWGRESKQGLGHGDCPPHAREGPRRPRSGAAAHACRAGAAAGSHEQTAAAAPGPGCADGGPSSWSRVRRVPQAEPSSHPRARRFRAFILEKVKACRYSNKIYKK